MAIEIKSDSEVAIMREAGRILADVLDIVMAAVQPGVRETDIDDLVRAEFTARDVVPTFLGYNGYPATVCISVNDGFVMPVPIYVELEDGRVLRLGSGTLRGNTSVAQAIPLGQLPVKRALLNYYYDVLALEGK